MTNGNQRMHIVKSENTKKWCVDLFLLPHHFEGDVRANVKLLVAKSLARTRLKKTQRKEGK